MTKYFTYAIGEIILVVIGILIALQINNWNEIQKSKAQEKEVLLSLTEELQNNNKLLEQTMAANEYINKRSLKLIDSINSGYSSFKGASVLTTTAHNPRVFNFPVMTSILNQENSLVTTKKQIIPELRILKVLHENIDKNLYYLDENWNHNLSKFSIECGFTYDEVVKNEKALTLNDLEKCGYPKQKLKGIISLTVELRRTWFLSMQQTIKKSETILTLLNRIKQEI